MSYELLNTSWQFMNVRPVEVAVRDSFFQNEYVGVEKQFKFLELQNEYGFVKEENATNFNETQRLFF